MTTPNESQAPAEPKTLEDAKAFMQKFIPPLKYAPWDRLNAAWKIISDHLGDKGQLTPGLDLEAIEELYAKGQREFLTMQDTKRLLESIPELVKRLRSLPSSPLTPALEWTKEKPTEGDNHYHFREKGGKGRTIIFLSGDGDEAVTFYNGRREYLGNIHGEFAGPIPPPNTTKGEG